MIETMYYKGVKLNAEIVTYPVNKTNNDILTIEETFVYKEPEKKPLNERDVINVIKTINEEEIAEQKFWDMVNARCHDER